jgi:PAS domain S-box-containing protein
MKKQSQPARKEQKARRNGARIDSNGRRDRASSVRRLQKPKTKLESAVQRYVDLYDFAPIAYVSFDRAGRIEEVNLAATELLGESRDLIIGRPFALYVADLDLLLKHLLLCRTSQQEVKTELLLKNKQGQQIPAVLLSNPVSSTTKNLALLYQTAIIDLRDLKTAEAKLRTSEQRYKTLFDLIPVAVYTCDADGIIQEYNRRAVELWGSDPGRNGEEPRFCGSLKLYYPDGRPMPHEECPMARALRGEKLTRKDLEIVIGRPDGKKRDVIPAPKIVTDERGKIIGAINCLFDITERKQTEKAALRLAAVVESSHDAIAVKTLNGIITDWNRGAERIFGYKPKEIIGKSVLTLIPKGRQNEEQKILRTIRRGESLDHYETVRRRKDGKLIDVALTISPIKGPNGEILGVSKIARDITKQKRTAQRLAEQARLLDLSSDAIIVRDRQDRIVYWNRGAEEVYGFRTDEAVGKITHELLRTEHPENLKRIRKRLERSNYWSGELVHTRKDGKAITVFSRWSLDRDASGRPASILETNTDITARKRSEQQQRALYQFGQVQHIANTVAEIYDAALDAILPALNCDRASILLFDKEKVMRFVAWRGLSEKYRKAVEGHSPWKPNAKRPEAICISDVDIADIPKALKSTIRSERIRAAAFIPLVSSRKLIGKFMTYYDAPHVFTDDEVKLATTLGTQLAQAIEHKRDEEALRQSEKQLARELEDTRLLQQTSSQLIHQDDEQLLYEKILDAAVGTMRSDFASIQMLYPQRGDAGELRLLAYRGYTRESAAAWEWIPGDRPTSCGMALRRSKRTIIPDVEACDWLAGTKDLTLYRKTGVRALQSTPLISRSGKKLGMISTGWKHVQEPSERDLRLMDVLARQAADVIERRQSEAALQQKEAELEQIVTQTPFMLTRCTRDLHYRYVSRAYAEMFGRKPDELARKAIVEIIGKEALKTISPHIEKVLNGRTVEYEMEVQFRSVGPRWINCVYVPDRDSDGNVVGWFASLIDIGARKKAEAMLQRSKELLEERVRERTRELDLTNNELQSEITRRKGLEGEILSISDREQQRLGQELHDGLCQHLTAVAFMARSVALRLKNHRVIDAADIEKIAQLVNDAATNTRDLSRALHRLDVDAAGLVTALQDLADREIWRIPCRLEVSPSFRIEDDIAATHLYRIAREAVINANKHAQARQIVIRLERWRKGMVARIIDDGIGLPKDINQQGLGFHIMKYRAELIGGTLEVNASERGGTIVSCYVPGVGLKSQSSANGDKAAEFNGTSSRRSAGGKLNSRHLPRGSAANGKRRSIEP